MIDFGRNTELVNGPIHLIPPPVIDASVLSLCSSAAPGQQPVRVRVDPFPGGRYSECYSNVALAQSKIGGEAVQGWAIWQWSRVFVEAEHHCVLQLNGELVDVSPHVSGETEVLFVPWPARVHDPDASPPIANIRHALSNNQAVLRFLEAVEDKSSWEACHRVGREVIGNPRDYNVLQLAVAFAKNGVLEWLRARTGRNDLCICGREKKFKRCHG